MDESAVCINFNVSLGMHILSLFYPKIPLNCPLDLFQRRKRGEKAVKIALLML